MINSPVIILACGGLKRPVRLPALELYYGPYFEDARLWAVSVGRRRDIYILSALHGLIPADQVIAPYDVRLDAARAAELVDRVRWQAARLLEPCTALELPWFCGGAEYSELLALADVRHLRVSHVLPPGRTTRGLGAQRRWYRGNLGRLPSTENL